MPGLKLSMAASLCGKPYKWTRTIATSSTAATMTSNSSPSSSIAFGSNREWRRIALCAHLVCNCYYYNNSYKNLLGFTFHGHNCYSLLSRKAGCFSAHKTGGFSGPDSTSSGSDVVADIGSGNKVVRDVDWYQNDGVNGQNKQPSTSVQNHHHQQQQPSYSKLLTLPTILTIGRVVAVPLLIGTFYVDSLWGRTATTTIFVAAAITDWLDGYLARKMRLGSAFGAFLDPVADKLMVAATLVLLCSRPLEVAMFGQVPWLLTVPSIAIIGREITMSAVREWAASQNSKLLEAVAVNNLGKWKTTAQMTALTILLATRDSSLGAPGIFVASGVVLLYISAGLSVWSLAVYMSKIWRILLK